MNSEANSPGNHQPQPSPAPPFSKPKPMHGATIPGQAAQVVLIQQPYSVLKRWIAWFGWVGFGFCLILLMGMSFALQDYLNPSNDLQEKFVSGNPSLTGNKVAILSITGMITDGSGYVKKQIDRIRKDENVKAVVVRVNSPGGTITGSDFIYHHLCKLRDDRELPIVVSMGSLAASGGYYVSMVVGDQERSIYAEPTTTTGSIGVIIPHYDLSGLMEKYKVKDDSLATHPRKKMLSMTKPISEDDRMVLNEYLQSAFTRFKDIVKSGRPQFRENGEALDELATGEIFTATKAKEKGLVDEIGFIEAAIERALELANLEKEKTRVVKYTAPPTLADALGVMSTQHQTSLSLEKLIEYSSPKAYYLSTSLPAILSSFENGAH